MPVVIRPSAKSGRMLPGVIIFAKAENGYRSGKPTRLFEPPAPFPLGKGKPIRARMPCAPAQPHSNFNRYADSGRGRHDKYVSCVSTSTASSTLMRMLYTVDRLSLVSTCSLGPYAKNRPSFMSAALLV